jgi:hypothetical protein
MPNSHSATHDAKIDSRRASLRRRVEASSYSAVCQKIGVSKGALWKFIHTRYVPTDPTLYHALGLGELVTVIVRRDRAGRFAPRRQRV